jgi:hypothetical protein
MRAGGDAGERLSAVDECARPSPDHDPVAAAHFGVSNDTWIVLDALRKKRNLNDYTGAPLSEAEAEEAIRQAEALLERLQAHLRKQHPHLIR